MKIIITGASSFIGRACIEELSKRNHKCIAVRHSLNELSAGELEALRTELSKETEPSKENEDSLKSALLHFAWAGVGSSGRSDAGIQRYNIEMSEKTLEIAAEIGVDRFIFAGSQAEYGRAEIGRADNINAEYGRDDIERSDNLNSEFGRASEKIEALIQSEACICHPISEYGKAKLEFGQRGAAFCTEYNKEHEHKIKFIHTRIFSVYGESDHETSLVKTCIDNFINGKDMDFGAAVQDWNYMHIEDAVRALILLCEYDFKDSDSEIINIAGEEIHPLRWYIDQIYKLCKAEGRKNFGVLPDRAEGNTSLRPDVSKLKAMGFKEQISFDEGISRLLAKRKAEQR